MKRSRPGPETRLHVSAARLVATFGLVTFMSSKARSDRINGVGEKLLTERLQLIARNPKTRKQPDIDCVACFIHGVRIFEKLT